MDQPLSESTTLTAPRGLLGGVRRTLFARPRRLRATVLTATAVVVLLIVLDLVLYAISAASTDQVLANAPEVARLIKAQARIQLLLILLASVIFLAGVVLVGVMEAHRTAGAAAKLARHLGEIEHGRYGTRLQMRREDHLREVERAFNQMTRALQDRTLHEVETLERLADRARLATPDDNLEAVALELRGLAARMRRAVEG